LTSRLVLIKFMSLHVNEFYILRVTFRITLM